MGRSRMSFPRKALITLALCLVLTLTSQVSGKSKHYLIETKDKGNDYHECPTMNDYHVCEGQDYHICPKDYHQCGGDYHNCNTDYHQCSGGDYHNCNTDYHQCGGRDYHKCNTDYHACDYNYAGK